MEAMRPPPLLRLAALLLCALAAAAPATAIRLQAGPGSSATSHSALAWEDSLQAAWALVGDGRAGGGPSEGQADGGGHLQEASPQQAQGPKKQNVSAISIVVAVGKGQYNISPYIYGVNEYANPNWSALKDAGIQLMRKGGNAESRYNWEFDSTNRAADYYFIQGTGTREGQPSSFDKMQQNNMASGIATVATIPVMNWLPKSRDPGCSFSIRKYGQQKARGPGTSTDCGNGILLSGKQVKNNVRDVATWTDATHQQNWVASLVRKFGNASSGGVKFYCMDNEPVWWSYNHWDIHPEPSSYDEITQKTLTFAPLVKKADPTALILGPVSGGWSDVFFSIKDLRAGWGFNGKWWSNPVDRKAHGNKPFIQYYLEQMKAYEQKNGVRILDVVDFHAYLTKTKDKSDPASQAQRIDDVRKLWDANYRCDNCVDPITAPDNVPRFITRVKEIINSTYPGLGMAITEYSFGGDRDITGAVAQAEALGVFGKTGVTIGAVFSNPNPSGTIYMAFKMFGNFDGKGGRFGSRGVQAQSSDYLTLSSYAAIDKVTNRLTILINNLKPAAATAMVKLQDLSPNKTISSYQLSAANLSQIVALPPIKPSKSISLTVPGYSTTLLAIPL